MVALWLALFGCGAEPETESEVLDVRVIAPDAPLLGAQLFTADMSVPAYSEVQTCTFGTWTGEEVAIRQADMLQASYGHHVVLFSTTLGADEFPDGTQIDCANGDVNQMLRMLPLIMPTATIDDGITQMALPEGMAVKLEPGTRYVLQSHYVNTTPQTLLARDVVHLEGVPVDSVDTWVSTIVQAALDFEVPAGETADVLVPCTFDREFEVMTVMGHMHEHGTAFAVDHVTDEASTRIYDIPEWDPSFRDVPPRTTFAPGELVVRPGDRFDALCSFDNVAGDEALRFPTEMCAFTGLVFPAEAPIMCTD